MKSTRLTAAFATLVAGALSAATDSRLYVGTYTPKGGASLGIYAVGFDSATGALGEPVLAARTTNPSFLAFGPDGRVLYALDESDTGNGMGGGVAAFAVDPARPALKLINREMTAGASTAHLAVDATGKMVVTASYTGGQVAAFPLNADGSLGPRSAWQLSKGAPGPNKSRQESPHPHSATFSPDNRFVYVCDLGLDKIVRYQADPSRATLAPTSETATVPGAGPRHSVFSPDGSYFYVLNELNGTVASYRCDAATGTLTPVATVSTLPAGFKGQNTCAEIALHPNGRFLYASNRGHDSIAVFARDAATGGLALVEIAACGGHHPRHFALSPDGAWLVCANRDSDNLAVFKVDPATGRLAPAGHPIHVPQPVCVLFAPGK
jgi:6-phosphogluconolactonase